MSGTAQGLPQRMTAFVDPKTGLVSDTWWRFLNSLWQRTGGATSVSSLDDVIQWQNMADTAVTPDADQTALTAVLFDDTPAPPDLDQTALLAAFFDDTLLPDVQPEDGALLAAVMADVLPPDAETDPAIIAIMVAD